MSEQLIGRKLASVLCDVSERRLYQLVQEGVIEQAERGRFDLVKTVVSYVRFLRERGANADGDHREKLARAKAELAQIEADRAAGRTVEVAAVEQVWTDAVMRFRQKMLSIPHKIAPVLAAEDQATECAALIEGQIYEALAELADSELESADEIDGDATNSVAGGESAAAS